MWRLVLAFALMTAGSAQAALTREMLAAFNSEVARNIGHFSPRCLGYEDEGETAEYYDVRAHEIHGNGCPGNPETSPAIAFLRYLKKQKVVLRADDNGAFKPITAPALDQRKRILEQVLSFNGRCKSLQTLSVDNTSSCKNLITMELFSDGGSSFTFYAGSKTKEPMALSFMLSPSGMDQRDNLHTRSIEGLLMSIGGKPSNGKAVGVCRFEDFRKQNSSVECNAEVSEGHFEGEFNINGK